MRIVLVGAGDVGSYLCGILSDEGHEVTLIEENTLVAEQMNELYNVHVLTGNGASADMLHDAGVGVCDHFMALTSDDKTNIISSSIAKKLGAASTVARIHDQTFQERSKLDYNAHFGIDQVINPEALCALEIAKEIRNPGRVEVENLARGEIEVQQVTVSQKSKYLDKSLQEVALPAGLRVGFIRRENNVEVATAQSVLHANDKLTLIGSPNVLLDHRNNFDPQISRASVSVSLYGGSEIAIALTRRLTNSRFRVRIIDPNEDVCRALAQKFPKVNVIEGDCTSKHLVEEEQLGTAEHFVACTKNDEENLMAGLQVHKLGRSSIHMVMNRVDFEEIIGQLKLLLGVNTVVSPRVATAKEVLRLISPLPYHELYTLPDKIGKIIQFKVGANSPSISKKVKELNLPHGTVVGGRIRSESATVPGAFDDIREGDQLLVITRDENIGELKRILVGDGEE